MISVRGSEGNGHPAPIKSGTYCILEGTNLPRKLALGRLWADKAEGNNKSKKMEPMSLGGLFKAALEVIASVWKQGAILLWSCAAASVAAFAVLIIASRFDLSSAGELKKTYDVYLLMAAAVLVVFATFKTYSERQARPLKLIAIDRFSMWGQARQRTGDVITAFSFRFQAANLSDRTVYISDIRLCRPWISRKAILETLIMTEAPDDITFGHRNPILPHTIGEVNAHVVIGYPVGRAGKKMNVTIKVQDHARNWYRLAFQHLKSAPLAPTTINRSS
jgi:hypothetical protein